MEVRLRQDSSTASLLIFGECHAFVRPNIAVQASAINRINEQQRTQFCRLSAASRAVAEPLKSSKTRIRRLLQSQQPAEITSCRTVSFPLLLLRFCARQDFLQMSQALRSISVHRFTAQVAHNPRSNAVIALEFVDRRAVDVTVLAFELVVHLLRLWSRWILGTCQMRVQRVGIVEQLALTAGASVSELCNAFCKPDELWRHALSW